MGTLDGKGALIIGAGRGMGRSIAVEFARQGARVAVAARTRTEIDAVADECVSGAVAIELDISREESCADGVRAAEEAIGPLDIVVNSAGISASAKFADLDTATWRRILTVDLDGAFWIARAVVPGMVRRRSGAVIMIGSLASRAGFPYIAPYVVAKHGLLGLTRALAVEYAASGVTFNCVCPWYADTPMTEATVTRIQEKTGRSRQEALNALLSPQGRLISPSEVTALCVLLASDAGRAINGQALNVDGGKLQS